MSSLIQQNRIEWVDQLKAICMALVVFTHCHENTANIPLGFKSIFYSIDRCGVPIFFMLSGAFIIQKANTDDIASFYIKRLPRFIVAIFFCCFITNFVYLIAHDNLPLGNALLTSLIKYNGVFSSTGATVQIWFMYPLILIYLLAPFIAKMVINTKTSNILFLLALSIIFGQLQSTLNTFGYNSEFLSRFGGIDFPSPYISYFIIGYLIFNKIQKNNKMIFFLATAIFIFSVSTVYYLDAKKGDLYGELHWYGTSLFIYISSISLVFALRFILTKINFNLMNDIGQKSFGIYLLHDAYIFIIIYFTQNYNLYWYNNVTILFLFSFLLSYITTKLLYKIPVCKYVIK
ncbi:Surface polysaccharide O-acyltransferase WecH (WecH) (PUBMED:16936038) [Commensalibacter communis]|uniref:acyltransferase n=1 Tax=Commensalibacter communis TaxID=2972786 RepID=UPI0022FFC0F2|nr:acyltransferase [Commensalibacter communis]CAI3925185.1 Surface polysaccharide O-acyltransferase WecH (WecH) (PUBMED:16936038) [Commensalibacter communis]CAI3934153.1 Surface polysaccharide O-acyltransferase WecH (WecH) (PUBMED:16936038) [Commensalibacter communis]